MPGQPRPAPASPRLVEVAIADVKVGDIAIATDGLCYWTIDVDEHSAAAIKRNPAKPEIGLSIVAAYRLTTEPPDDPIERLEEWRKAGKDRGYRIAANVKCKSNQSVVVLLRGCNQRAAIQHVAECVGPTLSSAVDGALAKAEGRS